MSRSSPRLLILGAATAIAINCWGSTEVSEASEPNIVVIYADDLGYGDVQCYSPERRKIPMPHIDALAADSMRFTDAHSSSGVCSPSRYTLLTGRYHWRTRLQSGIVGLWEKPLIVADRLTIGGLAKQHGYRTAAVGKWHLGWNWPASADELKALKKLASDRQDKQRLSPETATDGQRTQWQAAAPLPPAGPRRDRPHLPKTAVRFAAATSHRPLSRFTA